MHSRLFNLFVAIIGGLGVLLIASQAGAADVSIANTSSNTSNNVAAMRGFDPAVMMGMNDPHPDTANMSGYLNGSTEFGFGLGSGTSDKTICFMKTNCTFMGEQFFTNGGDSDMSVAAAFPEGGSVALPTMPGATQAGGYYFLNYVEDGDDGTGTPLFMQGLKNENLSGAVDAGVDCDTRTALIGQARCNENDFGFHQELAMLGGAGQGGMGGMGGSGTGPGGMNGMGRGDGDQLFDLFFSIDALVDANGDLLGEAVGTFTQDYTDVTNGMGSTGSCTGSFTYSTAAGYSGPTGECP